jgi:mitogen-activated protein kinase organizer 1
VGASVPGSERYYTERGRLQGHKGAVLCARYTRNGGYCVSGGADRSVRLWNPHKRRILRTFSGQHNSEVRYAGSGSG